MDSPWVDMVMGLLLVFTVGGAWRAQRRGGAVSWDSDLPNLPGLPDLQAAGQGQSALKQPLLRINYFSKLARQAGFSPEQSQSIYWASKILLGILPWLLMLGFGVNWLLPIVISPLGFMLPDLFLFVRRRSRQRKIRTSLSFFLDLLVALMSSGLTLTEAFRRAGSSLRHGQSNPLADEVELVAQELELGKPRATAFAALAERTGVPELARVAASLRLGLQLGSSLAEALEILATQMRARRREEAMARIHRASAQALVPLFLCGFPIFAVLVFFPAAVELETALEALQELIGP